MIVNQLIAYPDTPSNYDCLRFERYVVPLRQLLENPGTATPLTIGLFGPWGCGKSTVLRLVADEVSKSDGCMIVEFNPWIYRKEPNLVTPLLHTIHDELARRRGASFKKSAKKLWHVVTRLGAGAALKLVSAGTVDLDKLNKLEEEYLKQTAAARSELRQLRTTLQDIANTLREHDTRLVLFIDDLDRCEPIEIVDVLEGIKLFLDVDNVICVVAVDRSILDVGIEARYRKAGFPDSAVAGLGARYLDKIIQLPMYILPLSDGDIDSLIGTLKLTGRPADALAAVRKALLPNPRHVKRIANMLLATLLTMPAASGLQDRLIAKLAVLRVQFPDIFEAAVARPEFFLALAEVYLGKINVDRPEEFNRYLLLKEHVRAMCKQYYRADPFLEILFKTDPVEISSEDLKRHLFLIA